MVALNDAAANPTVKPFGVVADRAFANRTFIRHNTLEGVASITPARKVDLPPQGASFYALDKAFAQGTGYETVENDDLSYPGR